MGRTFLIFMIFITCPIWLSVLLSF
ncbi:hypothetical protein F885_03013, partial [Acinetobacter higginsii]